MKRFTTVEMKSGAMSSLQFFGAFAKFDKLVPYLAAHLEMGFLGKISPAGSQIHSGRADGVARAREAVGRC
jgi:hypothetical protein